MQFISQEMPYYNVVIPFFEIDYYTPRTRRKEKVCKMCCRKLSCKKCLKSFAQTPKMCDKVRERKTGFLCFSKEITSSADFDTI